MLKRCILAENRKLHASPIWILFFISHEENHTAASTGKRESRSYAIFDNARR